MPAFFIFPRSDTIDSADLREAFLRMNEGMSDVEDLIDATNVRRDRKVTFDCEFCTL